MSIRAEKVSNEIRKAIVRPINDLAVEHKAGLLTITSVRISKDLRVARIYFSLMGGNLNKSKFLEVLELNKSEIRKSLANSVRLRFVPELKFFYDDTLDAIEHISDVLKKVQSKEPGKNDDLFNTNSQDNPL
jgi:ribosome-binding factor A